MCMCEKTYIHIDVRRQFEKILFLLVYARTNYECHSSLLKKMTVKYHNNLIYIIHPSIHKYLFSVNALIFK